MKFPLLNPLQIFLGILGTTLVRTFLENFSNPEPLGGFTSFAILHKYFLFYAIVVFSVGIIMGILVKEPWMKHISRAVFFLPIIWIAPLVDLAISGGACMSYIGTSNALLIRDALTFFGPLPKFCGITLGIRFEILLILLGTGTYLWKKTRDFLKVALGILGTYLVIFFHLALPGVMHTLAMIYGTEFTSITVFFDHIISTLTSTATLSEPQRTIDGVTLIISRIHFVTLIILAGMTTLHEVFQKTLAWIRNARPVRIIYYTLITLAGAVAAIKTFTTPYALSGIEGVGVLILLVSIIAAWLLAVALNDLDDTEIDRVSNPERPLLSGTLSRSDMQSIAWINGLVMISGGLLINWNVAMMLMVFQASYSLYSLEPFRMKRHFIFSSFLVGLAGTSAFFAGFFFINPTLSFSNISLGLFFAVFGSLAIMSNTKDFKDIPGDTQAGIRTMPVLFGARKAGTYLTYTLVTWIIVWGLILQNIWVAALATPWIILDMIIRKRIPEYVRFLIVFAQLIILMVVL